jgi:hypothetical protein
MARRAGSQKGTVKFTGVTWRAGPSGTTKAEARSDFWAFTRRCIRLERASRPLPHGLALLHWFWCLWKTSVNS